MPKWNKRDIKYMEDNLKENTNNKYPEFAVQYSLPANWALFARKKCDSVALIGYSCGNHHFTTIIFSH